MAAVTSAFNLNSLYLDARHGAHVTSWSDKNDLVRQLYGIAKHVSPPYDSAILGPFREYIMWMKPEKYERLFSERKENLEPGERKEKQSILLIGEALLQREFHPLSPRLDEATKALQAVASEFFANLAKTSNRALLLLATNRVAPLAMWSSKKGPISVPHTTYYGDMGVNCGILSLPKHNVHGGISIWGGLTHENGHHIVDGIPDLMNDITKSVSSALEAATIEGKDRYFVNHFSESSKEIACDVLALLDSGPAFVLSLLTSLKAERGGKLSSKGSYFGKDKPIREDVVLIEGDRKLAVSVRLSDALFPGSDGVFGKIVSSRSQSASAGGAAAADKSDTVMRYRKFKYSDGHPVDISRLLVLRALLDRLDMDTDLKLAIQSEIDDCIEDEIELEYLDFDAETGKPVVKSHRYSIEIMKAAAEEIGQAIGLTSFASLEGATLFQVFPWVDADNESVERIRDQLAGEGDLDVSEISGSKSSPSYILSAATLLSCQSGQNADYIFSRMKKFLVQSAGAGAAGGDKLTS